MLKTLYTFLIFPMLWLGFYFLRPFNKKIAKGFELKKQHALDSLIIPSELLNKTWVWFHVASGELEYAKPVIRELKKRDYAVVVTFFSPSVYKPLSQMTDVDFFTPMPWDTPWHWAKFLKKFNPKAMAIARTDVWPQMIWQCKKHGVPTVLFSSTLPSHNPKVASFWLRLIYSFVFEEISFISCVSAEDLSNYLRMSPQIQGGVEGDTRYDQVKFRIENPKPEALKAVELIRAKFTAPFPEARVFIAGSTWPADDDVLVAAIKNAHEAHLKLKYVITPHEVSSSSIQTLQKKLLEAKIPVSILSQIDEPYVTESVLIVDQVGILADLYKIADLAFVGGSFRRSIHSVMEPLAVGAQVVFGPFHHGNREALYFKGLGYCREVEDSQALYVEFENLEKMNQTALDEIKNKILEEMGQMQGASLIVAQKLTAFVEKSQARTDRPLLPKDHLR